ncbi:MAG: AAA family ATPase [Pseudomonadota bacterium]
MSAKIRIALSGCSGGGKSALLAELGARGWTTVEEPGRAIVCDELSTGGRATPWDDAPAFAARVLDRAVGDYARAGDGVTMFDRSILDALVWYQRTDTALPAHFAGLCETHRYDPIVWLTPPWKAQFAQDAERRHGWEAAVAEFAALETLLPQMGYQTRHIPQLPLAGRADWLERALSLEGVAA